MDDERQIMITQSSRTIQVFLKSSLVAWAECDDEGEWSAGSDRGDSAAPGFTRGQIIDVMLGWAQQIQHMRSWTT